MEADCPSVNQCLGAVATAAHGPARHGVRAWLGRLMVYRFLSDRRYVRCVDFNAARLKCFWEFALEVDDQQAIVHRSTGNDNVVGEIKHSLEGALRDPLVQVSALVLCP